MPKIIILRKEYNYNEDYTDVRLEPFIDKLGEAVFKVTDEEIALIFAHKYIWNASYSIFRIQEHSNALEEIKELVAKAEAVRVEKEKKQQEVQSKKATKLLTKQLEKDRKLYEELKKKFEKEEEK